LADALLDPQTYEDPTENDEERDDLAEGRRTGCGCTDRGLHNQPFDRQTLNWDDKPQSKEQLENRTRSALESDEYDIVREDQFPPNSVVPEGGLPATGGQAYMRWGWTALNDKEPIDWRGWGYRKIVAKHGWGPTALERTSQALFAAPARKGLLGAHTRDRGAGSRPEDSLSAGDPAVMAEIVATRGNTRSS
jgi:hypothetical protein